MRKFLAVLMLSAVMLVNAMHPAHALLAMRISSLTDMNLPTWNIGDGAINASMNVCIYTYGIIPVGGYQITISSPGGYVLTSGAQQIPYSLYWDDGGAGNLGAGGTQLTNGAALANQIHGNLLDNNCSVAGPNARLNLKITDAAMSAALAGTYTGTITMLVAPY